MERYREEYKEYYDKIRKKVKGKINNNDKINNTREDIYPSVRNVQSFTYQRGNYGSNTQKKSMGYIDRFILRLICAFLLFLVIFTLKTIPNNTAKEIYGMCKSTINTNFKYDNLLLSIENMGIDYKGVLNVMEEKYTDVMSEIKNLDNEIPSFKEQGEKTNLDESSKLDESSNIKENDDTKDKNSTNE